MNVFVTGGTGVLGQPTVRLLIERGHTVHALARSTHNQQTLQALGAEPIQADLFDPTSLREAIANADAVLHLATRIPPTSAAMGRPGAWDINNRIRIEGTRNLVDAALAAGTTVVVYPSIIFVYPDRGAEWIDAVHVDPVRSATAASTLDAEAEVARFAASGGRRGISLRFGTLYGPASSHTQERLELARQGIANPVGDGDAYDSLIWAEDAASALVAAMERAPSGIYDVVDDEPMRQQDVIAAIAAGVGRDHLSPPPRTSPTETTSEERSDNVLARSLRVSNRRFKDATGWTPAVPNARAGWQILGSQPEVALTTAGATADNAISQV